MPAACPAATRSNNGWPPEERATNDRVDLPQAREVCPTTTRRLVVAAFWLWRAQAAVCGIRLPAALEQRLARSGLWGALVLGALIDTVMSPCATPTLVALAFTGSGATFGASMWWGAMLLLAYGVGHSALLLVAGAMPGAATAMMRRFDAVQGWLPGRRSFAALLAVAGLWRVIQGLRIVG